MAKMDQPPTGSSYRLVVEVGALTDSEEDNGWTVLATTVSPTGLYRCRHSLSLVGTKIPHNVERTGTS